jgi:integrase
VDLTVLQWKDVTLCTADVYRLRFRGLKGSEIGSRLHFRFVKLQGLLTVLRPLLSTVHSRPPDEYVFDTVTRARFVYALKREDPDYTGHSLRRGCATHLANKGVSIKRISEHLGHKDINTTRLYIAPTAGQRESRETMRLTQLAIYANHSRH